jgi:hypothetical protein
MAKTSIEWTDFTWSPIRARLRPDARAIAEKKGYQSLAPALVRIGRASLRFSLGRVARAWASCPAERRETVLHAQRSGPSHSDFDPLVEYRRLVGENRTQKSLLQELVDKPDSRTGLLSAICASAERTLDFARAWRDMEARRNG